MISQYFFLQTIAEFSRRANENIKAMEENHARVNAIFELINDYNTEVSLLQLTN